MLNESTMWKVIAFLLPLNVFASLPPFKAVELVEAPADRCLSLELDKSRLLCVSEFGTATGNITELSEIRFQTGKTEKRKILELRDTSNLCQGSSVSVSRFFGFESRDVNLDGRLDAVILIRAGKLKRRNMKDGECSPTPIGTAVYEVSYVNLEKALEAFEPSYPVLQRLRSLQAVQFAE